MPKNITHKFQPKKFCQDGQIIYLDENDFIKKYKGLRRICPKAFKYLCFDFFNQDFTKKEDGAYIEKIPTSAEFKFIYGEIELHYQIVKGRLVVENLTPEKIFLANYFKNIQTYKGIPYVDEKDKFKIDLYNKIKGE